MAASAGLDINEGEAYHRCPQGSPGQPGLPGEDGVYFEALRKATFFYFLFIFCLFWKAMCCNR